MRCLERNKSNITICFYEGKEENMDSDNNYDGTNKIFYSNPLEIKACVSPTNGQALIELFGTDLKYDKVVTIDNLSLTINEQTLFFIDNSPNYDPNTRMISNSDYIVKKIAKSLNVLVVAVVKG